MITFWISSKRHNDNDSASISVKDLYLFDIFEKSKEGNDLNETVVASFSDGIMVFVTRKGLNCEGLNCECHSVTVTDVSICRHTHKLLQKFNLSIDEPLRKLYMRMMYLVSKPCCAICLESSSQLPNYRKHSVKTDFFRTAKMLTSFEKIQSNLLKRIKSNMLEQSSTLKIADNRVNRVHDMQITMSNMWLCEQCGLVIHALCCKNWIESALGSDWDISCFACKYSLTCF